MHKRIKLLKKIVLFDFYKDLIAYLIKTYNIDRFTVKNGSLKSSCHSGSQLNVAKFLDFAVIFIRVRAKKFGVIFCIVVFRESDS